MLDELNGRLFAAVVLRVVISPELPTVVAAADEFPRTAGVAVVPAAVPRSVTVSLPLLAGLLRGAASLAVVVTTTTPLAGRGLQGKCWVSNIFALKYFYNI